MKYEVLRTEGNYEARDVEPILDKHNSFESHQTL